MPSDWRGGEVGLGDLDDIPSILLESLRLISSVASKGVWVAGGGLPQGNSNWSQGREGQSDHGFEELRLRLETLARLTDLCLTLSLSSLEFSSQ